MTGSALCSIAYTQNQYRYYCYKIKALSYTINYVECCSLLFARCGYIRYAILLENLYVL